MMKELSLNILDITENSVKAGATLTEINIFEAENDLVLTITDNGCGMTKEILESVTNPFTTTRTTRKVGLGLPLLKLAAEQTGGEVTITSRHESEFPESHGTVVKAVFYKNHIDFTPLGDVVSTITTLIQGHPETDFLFIHTIGENAVTFDTRDLRETLEGIPLDTYEVIKWIEEYLKEQYSEILK
ncbi:MAG: sensor histidine kinase [Clostridia bacterium]|nr:sensor histidine kinase [Clostridia bacterium]